MKIPDDGIGFYDAFTFHLQQDPKYAVGAWMLRSEIQQQILGEAVVGIKLGYCSQLSSPSGGGSPKGFKSSRYPRTGKSFRSGNPLKSSAMYIRFRFG